MAELLHRDLTGRGSHKHQGWSRGCVAATPWPRVAGRAQDRKMLEGLVDGRRPRLRTMMRTRCAASRPCTLGWNHSPSGVAVTLRVHCVALRIARF
eukprot:tig00001327_g8250.t1